MTKTQHQTPAEEPDVELTRAAAGGDVDAQKRLLLRVLPRVRTTVQYLTGRRSDADDLIQESLLEILRSAQSFAGTGSLEAWADRICVRRTMRGLKKQRRYFSFLRNVEHEAPPSCAEVPAHQRLQRAQLRERLVCILQKLSEKQRVAVVLRLVYDHPVADIAHMLDVPLNTVRDRLRVGRAKLRKYAKCDPILREWIEANLS